MARGARGRGADKKKRGRKGWSENERAAHEKASQRMNDAKAAKEAEQAKAKEKEAKKRKNAFTNLLFGRKRNDADDSDEDDADSQNEVDPTELPGIDDDDDDGSDDDDDQQKMPADSAAAHSCTPVGQMHRTLEIQKNDLVRLLSMTRPLLLRSPKHQRE